MKRPRLLMVALVHAIATVALAWAQTSPDAQGTETVRAPYLRRGDDVARDYRAYREELERFFTALDEHLKREAPDLRAKILPPAPVPYGYQILPKLLPETPWQPRSTRIILSVFSWNRTEGLIVRDSGTLATLRARLEDPQHAGSRDSRSEAESVVGEYRKLVDGQKLMESQIQYNRLWQAEVVRNPRLYEDARALQEAALERQRLMDSPSSQGEGSAAGRARAGELSAKIEAAIRKSPTASFIQASHPDPNRWTLRVPLYTDIDDSAFIERFREAIESAWQVRSGEDGFAVTLDIRRLAATQLYPEGGAPAKGAHIDVAAHVGRFPQDGAVLTTGANTIYSLGRGIVLGPHAVGPSALVHEFGHALGFRDGYFRSYRDLGEDGYEIIEVILDPEDLVAAPEHGRVRREHFDQVLREKLR